MSVCHVWILGGCSREPVTNLDLIDVYEVATVKPETMGITFGDDRSMQFLSTGFSMPEKDSEGRDFIWGTGKTSIVEPYLLSRADRYVSCTLRPFAPDKIGQQNLRVVWNDESVGEFVLKDDRWHDFEAKVPARIQKQGLNRLEFRFSKTGVPADIMPGSSDVRELSAAFDALVLDEKPGFHSGSPVPVNQPAVEKRGARTVLRFPGPAVLSYSVSIPRNTRLDLRWMAQGTDLKNGDVAVSVVLSSENMESVLYRGRLKSGGKDWAEANCSLPESKDPVRIGVVVSSGGVLLRDIRLVFQDDVSLNDLFRVETGPIGTIPTTPRISGRPNVIVYLIDTLRADHMSVYGYDRPTTPCIAELAKEGILYERALAHNPWTKNSVAAIMTGRYPSSCRMVGQNDMLPDSVTTLAEAFSASGYYCAAFSTNDLISKEYGFDQGFDEFHQLPQKEDRREIYALSDELHQAILDSLGRIEERQPFFLYVHSTDPHSPYLPTPDFERFDRGEGTDVEATPMNLLRARKEHLRLTGGDIRHFVDLYDGEIAYNDRQIGRLLEELRSRDLIDNALIAMTSDHGEEFRDHGGLEHSRTLYEELLHVPLILKFPGGRKGARVPDLVRHVDLFPTLAGLCGVDKPDGLEGWVLPGLDGKIVEGESPRDHYAEQNIMGIVSYETDDEKVFLHTRCRGFQERPAPYVELFDKRSDPNERFDLARQEPFRAEYLAGVARLLHRYYTDTGRKLGETREALISKERESLLRQMGYVN